ncbi:MAG: DUF2063 domain-containing protein [Candidatus Binatia bacterium]
MLSLHELQSRFFASLARTPGGGQAYFDPVLVNCVRGQGQLGAEERINVYAEMYFARLVDVLKNDFPRVAALLGCERFHEIASQYLARYPSTHPSLRYLGHRFPDFLKDCAETTDLPFLGELATLEWARVEVFDALDTEPLRVEHLQHLAPEGWPALKFQVIPAFRVLHSEWPEHAIWHAAEAEDALSVLEHVQPEKTTLRIWRANFFVYHAKMDVVEQTALNCLLADQPFASVCAVLEDVVSPEESASTVGGLLLRWIEDGILACFPEQ